MATCKRRHFIEGFIILYVRKGKGENSDIVSDFTEDMVAETDDYIRESEKIDVIVSITRCLRK
jgi:hypothetical protein